MKILVVVDMQKDFVDGALGSAEAIKIVSNVCEKIDDFKGKIAVTKDTHQENYLETQEGKKLPVKHCIENTDGWKLNKTVAKAIQKHIDNGEDVKVFDKPTFGSLNLGNWISEVNARTPVEEIELIGLCTDICVISNALLIKAFLPEITITVDASCCAGVTPESHQNALNAMKMCQINIINE